MKPKTSQSKITRRQQFKLFLSIMAAFAILFLTLGIIIFNLFQSSTYRSIDKDIRNQVVSIQKQPNMAKKKLTPDPHDPNRFDDQNKKPDPKTPFQASILVFDSSGKLLNKSSLGNRYSVLKHINLNKDNVNVKQTLVVKNMNFRSILIKVSKKIIIRCMPEIMF
jgi:hypothetical protein